MAMKYNIIPMEKVDVNDCKMNIQNYMEIREYFLSCIKKYQKKCEIFQNIVVNCNKSISEYETILNVVKEDLNTNKDEIKIEKINTETSIPTINIQTVSEPTTSTSMSIEKKQDKLPIISDVKVSNNEISNTETIKFGNHDYIWDDNEDYVEDDDYDESCVVVNENNSREFKFVQNCYKKFCIMNNMLNLAKNNITKAYCFKITFQVKPPKKNIYFGSIPNDWIIPTPNKKLKSEYYKEYLRDGSLLSRIYNDVNCKMRNKIKYSLRKIIPYNTTEQFINNLKSLTNTYKYFFKTDIIGAYYNVTYKMILKTLREHGDICEHVEEYLTGFFDIIKMKENKKNYLYITNYSPLLFGLYLNRILGDIRFMSRYDDIILYSNDLAELKEQFIKLAQTLKNHGLYLNKRKTVLYNTDVNSIFIFKNLINIPSSGQLDEVTKNILKEYNKNGEYIRIACSDEHNIIKSALKQ